MIKLSWIYEYSRENDIHVHVLQIKSYKVNLNKLLDMKHYRKLLNMKNLHLVKKSWHKIESYGY